MDNKNQNIEFFSIKRWLYLKNARRLVKRAYPEPHLFPAAMRKIIEDSEYINEDPENQKYANKSPKEVRKKLYHKASN